LPETVVRASRRVCARRAATVESGGQDSECNVDFANQLPPHEIIRGASGKMWDVNATYVISVITGLAPTIQGVVTAEGGPRTGRCPGTPQPQRAYRVRGVAHGPSIVDSERPTCDMACRISFQPVSSIGGAAGYADKRVTRRPCFTGLPGNSVHLQSNSSVLGRWLKDCKARSEFAEAGILAA
jgi:hypothetical protein